MRSVDGASRRVMIWLGRIGISVMGSRTLAVRGRKSGEWRTTPVNLLPFEGERYLVAPRGHTQWVRNMRTAGGGELRLGRRAESFHAVEIPDADKPAILREYLRRWAWEVGMFFEDVDAKSPESRLLEIAPGFPVFRITPGA
ncbi:nitroreductase family deazaflavin-dependent oxidoreductase [Streptacidiphilus sp. PAMC 29251]